MPWMGRTELSASAPGGALLRDTDAGVAGSRRISGNGTSMPEHSSRPAPSRIRTLQGTLVVSNRVLWLPRNCAGYLVPWGTRLGWVALPCRYLVYQSLLRTVKRTPRTPFYHSARSKA